MRVIDAGVSGGSVAIEQPLRVLLVDDDEALRALLQHFFESRQIPLTTLPNAMHLAQEVARQQPTLIVLDLMMPGIDGLSALRQLRAGGDTTPVIMLTARDAQVDRVIGLESGADDYVGKPFMPQELLARINAVMRRHWQIPPALATAPAPHTATVRFGRFELDDKTRTLARDGVPVKLSNSEFMLLSALARHPMEVLSRNKLLALWHGGYAGVSERGLDVPIWRLRAVIEEDPTHPRIIRTIRGEGYMFVPVESADA